MDKHCTPGAFWLTGSQVFKLMQGVQESLAGRVAVLCMKPELSAIDRENYIIPVWMI